MADPRITNDEVRNRIEHIERWKNRFPDTHSDKEILVVLLDLRDARSEVEELEKQLAAAERRGAERREAELAQLDRSELDAERAARESAEAEIERMRQEWENLRGTAMVEADEVATLRERAEQAERARDEARAFLDLATIEKDALRKLFEVERERAEQAESRLADLTVEWERDGATVRTSLRERAEGLEGMVLALREALLFNLTAIENLQEGRAATWFSRDRCALSDSAGLAAAVEQRIRREALEQAGNALFGMQDDAKKRWGDSEYGRGLQTAYEAAAERVHDFAVRALAGTDPPAKGAEK